MEDSRRRVTEIATGRHRRYSNTLWVQWQTPLAPTAVGNKAHKYGASTGFWYQWVRGDQ